MGRCLGCCGCSEVLEITKRKSENLPVVYLHVVLAIWNMVGLKGYHIVLGID